MSQIRPVLPKMKEGNLPVWYHPSGNKIKVKGYDYANSTLFLGSNKVDISIFPDEKPDRWLVEYQFDGHRNSSRVWMSTNNLKTAFGLSDICDETAQPLLQEYGGDVAVEFQYIRYGDFLNIPQPGVGIQETPHLSIYLTDAIKDMLELIIE